MTLTKQELVAVAAAKWVDLWLAFDCMIVAQHPAYDRVESESINAQIELATQRLLDAVAELEP